MFGNSISKLLVISFTTLKIICSPTSRIKDFEIKYFKAKGKSTGIHELDIGIPKNESMWLAAVGDLDGDRK